MLKNLSFSFGRTYRPSRALARSAKLCRLAILLILAWGLAAQSPPYIIAFIDGPEDDLTGGYYTGASLSANCDAECTNGSTPYAHMDAQWYCASDRFDGEAWAGGCVGSGCTDVSGYVRVVGDASNIYYPGQYACNIALVYDCNGDYSGPDYCSWTCN